VVDLASAQHGVISRYQAEVIGVGRARLQSMQRRGLLIAERPRVWAVHGSPHTSRRTLLGLCLSYDGFASHRAAAELWDITAWRERPIELTIERTRALDIAGAIVHRTKDFALEDVTEVDSIPVTSAARTLVDLGAVLPAQLVNGSVNLALQRGLVTLDGIAAVVDRVGKRGRSGAGVLRQIIEGKHHQFELVESPLESAFLDLCVAHGLPLPEVQHEVVVGGRLRRLDHAWPDVKLCVEVHGYAHHSGRERFEDDRRRTNDLQLAGWTVLEFTVVDVVRYDARTAGITRRMLERLGHRL
jgi:hypothetical protein